MGWKCFSLFCVWFLVSISPAFANIPFDVSSRYQFHYTVEVPASSNGEEFISLWIPYPTEDQFQRVLSFKVESPLPYRITREKQFGNKMIYIEGKRGASPLNIRFTYVIERDPYKGIKKELLAELDFSDPKDFLTPLSNLPGYDQITKIAKLRSKGLSDQKEVIENFYAYIIQSMKYDKSGKGWGRGDPIWACENKRGNCTDFHSLFISLAREKNIPARFKMGVPVPSNTAEGEILGYHCWAEVYDASFGWTPLDASEAKKSGKIREYFGNLPSDRIEFSQGRNITLNPSQKGKPLNYFIYPYAEIEGKEISGIKKTFTFKRI